MTLTVPVRIPYAGPPLVPGYVLSDFLGRGSSGLVWSATSEATGEPVAVKLVAATDDDVEGALAAATRELDIVRRVGGVHVVRARELVPLEDGGVALVLDLADGGSLRDLVTIRGGLPLGEVVTSLTPLATTLAELHESGIVHGDLAPGNVLFTTDGRPLLADLASARLLDEGWPDIVHATSGFVAPEVVAGHPPTPASDVWSLGALAWYARTGGTSPPEWVGDLHWARPVPIHTSDDHGTLDDATAAVGPELRPLLLRMLADDPQVRPTAGEAALALYRVAAAEPVALVGHHPDPAAAVTNRIRREAAETRSRSQLRAVEKAAHRQRIRERRRARLRHPLRRMPAQPSPSAAPPHLLTCSSPRGKAPQSGLPPSSRRRAAVASALAVGLVLVAIGVFRWTDPFSTVLTTTPVADATALEPTPLSTGSAAISSVDADNVAADHVPGDGVAADTVGAGTVPRGSPATGGPQAEVTADPLAVLQHIADIRAGALREAESLALAAVEPEGSSPYENDVRTLARLRDQGQRYGDLAFVVRSADVVTADAATVVLRAQIDRAACTVVGPDGSVQTLPEQRGPTLRYTVQRARSGWQLTDVEAA